MTWGPGAVQRAQQEKKPLYLAVGTLTHELSRAMNRQTFSNPQVAALLNEHFVCVLIDRDELPAVAAYCQAYLNAKKQLSGWPANVWLTPELKPFEGATYLPPSEEWGKEGFMNIAQRAATAWKNDADAQRQKADDAIAEMIAAQTIELPALPAAGELRNKLTAAARAWVEKQDPALGGFGDTPRYPDPELLRFLLRQPAGRDAALTGLRSLARNASHDPVDGGFFRSTIDAAGRVPSFIKTSLDQARIATAFLEAYAVTKDAEFEVAARSALDFAYAHLRTPAGTYAAALDGSGDDNRTAFAWKHDELLQALGAAPGEEFARRHGALPAGNIRAEDDPSSRLAGRNLLVFGTPDAKTADADAEAAHKLRELRAHRVTFVRDETVVAGTQGWMLSALSLAGRTLGDKTYASRADALAEAVQKQLVDPATGETRRLAGAATPGTAADTLSLAAGYASLGSDSARQLAARLRARADADCLDAAHGRYFVAPAQRPELPLRPYGPEGTPAEPPRAEIEAILAAHSISPAHGSLGAPVESVARALFAQMEEAAGPVRGDTLLALAVFAEALP